MNKFKLISKFKPTGDQPAAIKKLVANLKSNIARQTLLGVTGSGKTFTMANVVAQVQRPTLIISHNKTLAAQLASEFQDFFPNHAVHYFVSYYDYYQPEAYIPRSDTYIEKETEINEEIDRLRNAATTALLTRRDVLIVASVSCIYGLGNPGDYLELSIELERGRPLKRDKLLRRMVDLQYSRNDIDLRRGTFRVRGEIVEIVPADTDRVVRVAFDGDIVEKIEIYDLLTGEILEDLPSYHLFPAKHFITPREKMLRAIENIRAELDQRKREFEAAGKLVEAQRLEQRTNFDVEMMFEAGYVNGVENYSRHLDFRPPGTPPSTLIDYFPDDFLLFIDESHMTVPQLRGMHEGDRARKQVLIDYGFRLPSAFDNRPLRIDEFWKKVGQTIFVSATPGPYELSVSKPHIIEQIIRPTGLLDPLVEVRPTKGQVADVVSEAQKRIKKGQRVLVTTLTKRMAEELSEHLAELGIKVTYLHSDIQTLERLEILRDLRTGAYDVLIGVNLLREGLDLPEVSLVAILDADKEGFLRSRDSLIQTIGRAARNVNGRAILYADVMTESMRNAISETNRRREKQVQYNQENGITPETIVKPIDMSLVAMTEADYVEIPVKEEAVDFKSADELETHIIKLQKEMRDAARNFEFEKAARLRDKIKALKEKEMEAL